MSGRHPPPSGPLLLLCAGLLALAALTIGQGAAAQDAGTTTVHMDDTTPRPGQV